MRTLAFIDKATNKVLLLKEKWMLVTLILYCHVGYFSVICSSQRRFGQSESCFNQQR